MSSIKRTVFIVAILLMAVVVLPGCVTTRSITIGSEPSGAKIMADGKHVGDTPMVIKQDEIFPPHMVGMSYMVKGKLGIEKDGCESVSMPVDDNVLSKDINVKLKCDPNAVIAAPAPSMKYKSTASPMMNGNSAMGQRLKDLQHLRDNGLITDDEYQEHRKRILNSL